MEHEGPRWSLQGPESEARTARRHEEARLWMARKISLEWEDEVASRREWNQEHMAVHRSLETADQIAARRDQRRSAERRSEDNHHAVWCPEGKRARADGRSPSRWACCFCWSLDWLIYIRQDCREASACLSGPRSCVCLCACFSVWERGGGGEREVHKFVWTVLGRKVRF